MKKGLLLASLFLLISCSSFGSKITGTQYAIVLGLESSLTSKRANVNYDTYDDISPTRANMYTIDINTHYFIKLYFNIGGGSIPPNLHTSSLHIDYNKDSLTLDRVTKEDDLDEYLKSTTYFDLLITAEVKMISIVFTYDKYYTSIVLSTK